MRKTLFTAACVLILCGVACSSRPDEGAVREIFRRKYPQHRLLDVRVDEDEGAARTFVVRYRDPNGGETFEQVWLYFDGRDEPAWEIKEPRRVTPGVGLPLLR